MKQTIGTILGIAITIAAIMTFVGGSLWNSTGTLSNSVQGVITNQSNDLTASS